MELYDKKFVYFDWDDKLDGKQVMVSDDIYKLKRYVNGEEFNTYEISKSSDDKYPFRVSGIAFRFCYYDPYYEIKRAYDAGMTIQYKYEGMTWNNWVRDDMPPDDYFEEWEWRIKPDDIIWKVVLSDDGTLGIAKTTDKHVYFEGTEEECSKWINEHNNFADIMWAWEREKKPIQFYDDYSKKWRNCMDSENEPCEPTWKVGTEYRIKEEYVPFDSVQELIDAWDEKYPQNKNRPKGTMPLIWIKNKQKNRVHLITNFFFERVYMEYDAGTSDYHFTLKELFEGYTFADDSIIGKVKEE